MKTLTARLLFAAAVAALFWLMRLPAEQPPHVITVRVPRALAIRAIDEAKLDALIRADVLDAGRNVVNFETRRRIRELCHRIEQEP